jgi:hypothetical protein
MPTDQNSLALPGDARKISPEAAARPHGQVGNPRARLIDRSRQ